MEELQVQHRKEQRDLQARITQKKKNATKKTRKGINDECDALQRDLQDRQQAEIAALGQGSTMNDVRDLQINGDDPNLDEQVPPDIAKTITEDSNKGDDRVQPGSETSRISPRPPQDSSLATKKLGRQKARLARRAAEQEVQAAQAAEEAASMPDLRKQELGAMQKHLDKLGLREIGIRPDGHCLFSAIATQLRDDQLGPATSSESMPKMPYQLVRTAAASFISNHPDDFSPFIEEPLESYVSKIKDTAEWGGQLELQAVARVYGVGINVLQADGRIDEIKSGSSSADGMLWLAYYRHSFGLGEHYNALAKIG